MAKQQLNRRTVLKGMVLAGIPMVSDLHFGRPTGQHLAIDANAKPLWGHICGMPILVKRVQLTEANLQSIVDRFDSQEADHKPAICRHWTETRFGLAPRQDTLNA